MNGIPSAGTGGTPPAGKKKILIVDDDKLLLGTYSSVFQAHGFEVVTAENGEDALRILQKGTIPDIVFTGIMMPKMGGFELIEKMRADPKLVTIPIAVSSHRGLAEDKARAQALGISAFIVRGFTTPQEIVRQMEILLGLNRKFKISIAPDRFSGAALVEFLNKQSAHQCPIAPGEEVILEFEATQEAGVFRVRIVC